MTINEAAIDWMNGGNNYPDVVSQAVDEAGGQAFVDLLGLMMTVSSAPVSDATLNDCVVLMTPRMGLSCGRESKIS